MIHIKAYNSSLKNDWNEFNKDSKNGLFMFNRDFMEYHSHRFIDHSLLFFKDNKLIALLPCNRSGNTLYSHQGLTFGGFITNSSMRQTTMLECFNALRNHMCDYAMHSLVYKAVPYVYHKYPAQEDIYSLFFHNAMLSKVECSSAIPFRNAIKISNFRNGGIKKALKSGVNIHTSLDFDSFVTLLNSVLHARHGKKAVHDLEELLLLQKRFPKHLELWIASASSLVVAGALLFIYEDVVHTQYLASSDYGREIGALDLLIYSIMQTYKDNKTYLDFGISNENNGRFLNEGLIFQKEGFGARSIAHVVFTLFANSLDSIESNDTLAIKNTTGGGGQPLDIFFLSLLFGAFCKYTISLLQTLYFARELHTQPTQDISKLAIDLYMKQGAITTLSTFCNITQRRAHDTYPSRCA